MCSFIPRGPSFQFIRREITSADDTLFQINYRRKLNCKHLITLYPWSFVWNQLYTVLPSKPFFDFIRCEIISVDDMVLLNNLWPCPVLYIFNNFWIYDFGINSDVIYLSKLSFRFTLLETTCAQDTVLLNNPQSCPELWKFNKFWTIRSSWECAAVLHSQALLVFHISLQSARCYRPGTCYAQPQRCSLARKIM
jgi:hypothetical protein